MAKWYKNSDMMMGLAVVAVVGMLIIPIPTFLLDLLMGISIMLGLVTILASMYTKENRDFSVFPTLLLVTTVFRLALNVSSTRLILLKGPAFDGQLIKAFGEFVVGGNYVVGFIIFLILVFVQMIVITKGANRMGEVAARFTLDALPGKQMSIDSDLQAGLITEEEARSKREEMRREADFYGQMDGATKFVQGDVRVGLIITAINIIGGLIIGVVQHKMDLAAAAKLFTLLTVGDGLVAQLPSLMITTATAMVVTRAGSKENLGTDLTSQLFMNPKILWMTSGTIGVFGLIPGFPKLSMFFIAAVMGAVAWSLQRNRQQTENDDKKAANERKPATPERFLDELAVEPLKLEIGFRLLPLVDPVQGGTLLDRVTSLRQKFAREMGMIIPPIRIADNMDLEGNEYAILVGGIEVSRARTFPDKLVALKRPEVTVTIEGETYKDPTFLQDGILIEPSLKNEAEQKGYMVVDPGSIIITQLSEVLRNYATQIMGREEVKMLLDKLKEKYSAVVDEVLKNGSLGIVQKIMHNLLKEGVSVRNMVAILESLADNINRVKDPVQLTEYVRQRLGRQIVSHYETDGHLGIIQVDPEIENIMRSAINYDEKEGRIFTLDPTDHNNIRNAFIISYNESQERSILPVFLCSSEIRMGIFNIMEREVNPRSFAVISFEELPNGINIKQNGQVLLSQEEAIVQ